jgi:predicted AAA+ superfamily ATPase
VTSRLVRTPKLYFLDTGLCAWLAGWSTWEALQRGAMAGAFFETWVVGEVLRSWWHRLRTPALFFYRDRDGREIDLLFEQDGQLWPVEIKAAATPRADWIHAFSALDRFPHGRGHGAVVCLHPTDLPLGDRATLFPAGWL